MFISTVSRRGAHDSDYDDDEEEEEVNEVAYRTPSLVRSLTQDIDRLSVNSTRPPPQSKSTSPFITGRRGSNSPRGGGGSGAPPDK